jgi:hypothetical protein
MVDVVAESMIVNPRLASSTPTASANRPPPGANAITLTRAFIWLGVEFVETFDDAQADNSVTESAASSERRRMILPCTIIYKFDCMAFPQFLATLHKAI